jgi:hypothetical protein
VIELFVFILVPIALIVGGLSWFLACKFSTWGRVAIVLLAPLPLPVLILAAAIGGMVYGWNLPGDECSLNECGGYMILGVLGIALAIGAFIVGIPAALLGVFIARRDVPPPQNEAELRESFK